MLQVIFTVMFLTVSHTGRTNNAPSESVAYQGNVPEKKRTSYLPNIWLRQAFGMGKEFSKKYNQNPEQNTPPTPKKELKTLKVPCHKNRLQQFKPEQF